MATMLDTRTLNLTMDFCLRVGELLLSSGAGAADVTATMRGLSWQLGLRNPEIDVTFTALSMSYQPDPEEPLVIQVRHVKQRDIDYEDLTLVDHLVRDVVVGHVELAEARTTLARIVSSGHSLPRWAVSLGWGVMCGGVGLMLGGNAWVVAIAFASAVSIDRLQMVMSRRRLPFFYQQAAGGAVATILAALAALTPLHLNESLVVTANIIMLLAGVGFMGALQDALSGFYLTAGARLTEALLATAGIIAGVSGGLTFADVIGVNIGGLDLGLGDSLKSVSVMALGAAITAGAFAFSSYAPRRIILPIALIAAVAMTISQSSTIVGLRQHLADRDRGVPGRSGQLHRRRPDAGAAPGGRGVRGRADAARPLDLPRAVPAGRGRPLRLARPAVPDHGGLGRAVAVGGRDPRRVRRPAAQAGGVPPREPPGRSASRRSAAAPNRSSQARWVGPSKGAVRAVTAALIRSEDATVALTTSSG